MKTVSFFIVSILLGIIVFAVYNNLTQRPVVQQLTEKPSPSGSSFSILIPPSESLKAKVTALSGKIKWQSRIATEAAEANTLAEIQQGEQIETDEDGRLVVEFPNVWKINISSNTKLDFAQTLPANLVIAQSDGTAEYQKLGENVVSVRALHLLINQNQGDMVVTVDKDNSQIFVNVKTGSIKVVYNDDENISQIVEVKSGQRLNFDDEIREIIVK